MWVELEQKPPKIAFWTTLTGTLATGVGAAIAYGVYLGENQAWHNAYDDGPQRARHRETGDAALTASGVLAVSAGVFAAGTVISAVFTDWE